MLGSDVEIFLATHRVTVTEEGDAVLTPDDTSIFLTGLLQSDGPWPAYVDVYSRAADGRLRFEEDLTMRDLHDSSLGRRECRERIIAYLSAYGSGYLVSPNDFSRR